MKKILIIGGGFSGLTAAYVLAKRRTEIEIVLVDKKKTFDFLPALPDCLGRGISLEYLSFDIEKFAGKNNVKFLNQEVTALNISERKIVTDKEELSYDYLIIASGSQTNFYGNQNIQESSFKIDCVEDTLNIKKALNSRFFSHYVIGGGGYTGVEVATNLKIFLEKNKKNSKVIIIERVKDILGTLEEWMKDYARSNLKTLGIEILTDCSIERIEGGSVFLSQGRALKDALVIWTAGVRTSDFIQGLDLEKNPQGRIKVDEYLRVQENCYVVGDASYFQQKDIFLRMAVQFSIAQGRCAAENIIREIKGKKLKSYKPQDLGYIIPMANNRSCGLVLNLKLKGILPTFFHFIMCIYRSPGIRNKLGLIKGLLGGEK